MSFNELQALELIESEAKKADYAIVLSYSVNPTILERYIIANVKDFRLLYSCNSRDPFTSLEKYSNKIKRIEPEVSHVTYEVGHGKVYLFAQETDNSIELSVIIGSFNLMPQERIEIFTLSTGKLNKNLIKQNNFMEIFNSNLSLDEIQESFSGDSVTLQALTLLITHWHDKPFFLTIEEKRKLVTTYDDSLKLSFISMISEAIRIAKITNNTLEFLFVVPFHTESGIRSIISLIEKVMENLGSKLPFSVNLLTNSHELIQQREVQSYTNPLMLKTLVEDINYPLKEVRFWGGIEKEEIQRWGLHLKAYVIKAGENYYSLVGSNNLTEAGWGFKNKNLEVSVVEMNTLGAQELWNKLNWMWENETTPDENTWLGLINWYQRGWEDEEPKGFSVEGIKDSYFIGEKATVFIKTKKKVRIDGHLSFPSGALSNLPLNFSKIEEGFISSFTIEKEYLGKIEVILYAETEEHKYFRLMRKIVKVENRFPEIKIDYHIQKEQKILYVDMRIQKGDGIQEVSVNDLRFRGSEPYAFEIRNKEKERIIRIFLPIKTVEVAYKTWFHKIVVSSINEENVFSNFLREVSIELESNPSTLCQKKEAIFTLNCDRNFLNEMKVKNVKCFRKVQYYDYYSLSESITQLEERKPLRKKIQLSNKFDIPTKVAKITCNFFGERTKEDNSVFLILLGIKKYPIYRDPPEIDLVVSSPRSNIHELTLTFTLKEPKDINFVEIEFGFAGKKSEKIILTEKSKPVLLDFFKEESFEDLKNGLNICAHFKFLFNVADEIIKEKIKFHYYSDLKNNYPICSKNPTQTLYSNLHFNFQIFPIQCKPQLDFIIGDHKCSIKSNESNISLNLPKPLLEKFRQEGNNRISHGNLKFITNNGKESIGASVSSFRFEKNNATIFSQGGYWKDIVIIGPEGSEPPNNVENKAKEVFLQYLTKEKSRLEKNKLQTDEISEIISSLESQTYKLKPKTEYSMKRYGASSQQRMLADVVDVELNPCYKIQFLIRDIQNVT